MPPRKVAAKPAEKKKATAAKPAGKASTRKPAPTPVGKPPIGEISTVPIPSKYLSWVEATAKNTGLPISIIAAQITVESDWNPNAESPAGARGIAQFEPGTWEDMHCSGSWWSPYDSFVCYTKLMRQLISEFHGNLRNVLAAYNAGPGDLAAGYGYADEIIAMAGGGTAISAGGESVGTITLPALPSTSQDSWSDYVNEARSHLNSAVTAVNKHKGSVHYAYTERLEYENG